MEVMIVMTWCSNGWRMHDGAGLPFGMKSSEEETIWFWEIDLGMDDINKLGVGLIDACWIGGFGLIVLVV
jgi:hypothetical protein